MKRAHRLLSCLLIACAATAFGGFSCVAQKARDNVLAPTVASTTDNVLAETNGADPIVVQYKAAVLAKDWTKALTLWPQVRAAEELGVTSKVAAGSIGPHVAESLLERLGQYDADLKKLGGAQ